MASDLEICQMKSIWGLHEQDWTCIPWAQSCEKATTVRPVSHTNHLTSVCSMQATFLSADWFLLWGEQRKTLLSNDRCSWPSYWQRMAVRKNEGIKSLSPHSAGSGQGIWTLNVQILPQNVAHRKIWILEFLRSPQITKLIQNSKGSKLTIPLRNSWTLPMISHRDKWSFPPFKRASALRSQFKWTMHNQCQPLSLK